MPHFQLPSLALIDLDGTLVDTLPDIAYCVQLALAREGCHGVGMAQVSHWIGNGVEVLVQRALAAHNGTDVDKSQMAAVLGHFDQYYARHNGERSTVYPGVAAGLAFLREAAIPVVCVTNKPQRFTLPLLESCGLLGQFSLVVSGDTLAQKKPDPAPLHYACTQHGVAAAQCLFIGDSINDVRAARRAGMPIICVDYGYNHGNSIVDAEPDAVISSMADIPTLCV